MRSLGNIFKRCIVTFAFCSEIGISNQSMISKLNEVVNICSQLRLVFLRNIKHKLKLKLNSI